MDEIFSEDSLSAYFDGEVTSDERARIEDRLTKQPELQRELDQVRQVSDLVRQLEGPSAPAELRASVMHRIEREMLLGPPPTPVPAGHPNRRHSRWIYGGGVFAVAAALLITVAYYAGQFAAPDRPEGEVIALNDRLTQPSKSSSPSPEARSDAQGGERMTSKEDVARIDRSEGVARSPSAPSSASAPALTAAPQSGKPTAIANALGASRQSQLVFREAELREAEIGDVVKAFEHVEGKVSVVYLTVVDRAEGLQGFQRALARNSIMQQPEKPAEFDKVADSRTGNTNEFAERVRSHKAGDLECVYVEAPGEQLVAALRELRAEMQINELRVEEPVSLAQLDDRSGNQLLAGRLSGEGESASARDKSSSSEKESSEISDAKDGQSQGEKKADDSSKGNSDAKSPSAVQDTPADAPAKKESAQPANKPVAESLDGKSKSPSRSVNRGERASEQSTLARQVQVTLPESALGFGRTLDGTVPIGRDADGKSAEQPRSSDRQPVVASRPRGLSQSLVKSQFGAQATQGKHQSAEKPRTEAKVQVLFVLIDSKTGQQLPSTAPPAAAPMKKARRAAPGDKHDDGAAS